MCKIWQAAARLALQRYRNIAVYNRYTAKEKQLLHFLGQTTRAMTEAQFDAIAKQVAEKYGLTDAELQAALGLMHQLEVQFKKTPDTIGQIGGYFIRRKLSA